MYDDRPYVWVQILKPGDKSVIEQIQDAYMAGEIKKK